MKLFLKAASVAVICASFLGSASAMDMSLGVKGALNLATTWGGEDIEGVDNLMKPGLIIGALLEMKLTENFSVQPEVLFTSKGGKEKSDFMGTEMTIVGNLNYLEVPVLLKLNIPAGIAVPNFYVGPAVAFRVGVSGYNETGDEKSDWNDEMIDEVKENTNGVDFGLAMGGGCNFIAGPGAVVLDIRYTLGLMKLASEDDMGDDKNGVLSFLVGYTFNIGG